MLICVVLSFYVFLLTAHCLLWMWFKK